MTPSKKVTTSVTIPALGTQAKTVVDIRVLFLFCLSTSLPTEFNLKEGNFPWAPLKDVKHTGFNITIVMIISHSISFSIFICNLPSISFLSLTTGAYKQTSGVQ